MLQIASGLFFESGEIETGDFDAVLYSNFSWISPVLTAGGELLVPCNLPPRSQSR